MPDPDFELHDYEILGPLSEGGMAETFLARRRGSWGDFSRLCVIKRPLVHSKDFHEGELQGLFAAEVTLCATLQHPNIPLAFDSGEDEHGVPFLAMEYIDGISLETLLQLHPGELPIDVVAMITASLALALNFAHEVQLDGKPGRVVHRDVSPQNVIIDRNGHVWLIDFGAALFAQRGRHTRAHEARGKNLYMSPEHLGDIAEMDGRSDLFSLGVILYRMLTGTQPFEGRQKATLEGQLQSIRDADYKDPRLLARNLPRPFVALIQQLLAPRKEDRPSTAQVVALACAEHFRPIGTQLELATIVQAALRAVEAPILEQTEAASHAQEPFEAAQASAAVATMRPPAGTHHQRTRPPKRSPRARSKRWWSSPSSLAIAAAFATLAAGATAAAMRFAHNLPSMAALAPLAVQRESPSPQHAPTAAASTHVGGLTKADLPTPTASSGPRLGAGSARTATQPDEQASSAPPASLPKAEAIVAAAPSEPTKGSLTVGIAAGCIFLDGRPVGRRNVKLRNLRPGPHELGFSSDCKSDIDERLTVTVRAGANPPITYPYFSAELPAN